MKHDEKKCPRCAEAIKRDAKICRHCGQEFSDEEIAAEHAARKRDVRNGLWGCGILVVILVIAIVAMIGRGEADASPSIENAAPTIASVDITGVNVNVRVDLDVPLNDKISVTNAAEVLDKIGRAIQAGAPGPTEATQYVQVSFTVPTIGRLGDEGRSDLMNARLPIEDVRKAHFETLAPWGSLNLIDDIGIGSGVGGDALTAFCGDPEFAEISPHFCMVVAAELVR